MHMISQLCDASEIIQLSVYSTEETGLHDRAEHQIIHIHITHMLAPVLERDGSLIKNEKGCGEETEAAESFGEEVSRVIVARDPSKLKDMTKARSRTNLAARRMCSVFLKAIASIVAKSMTLVLSVVAHREGPVRAMPRSTTRSRN